MLKLQQISLIAFQAVLTRPGERLQMWVKRQVNVGVFMVAAPKMGKNWDEILDLSEPPDSSF